MIFWCEIIVGTRPFLQVLFCLFVWVMLFELNLKHYGRLFKNSINNYLLTALEKENGNLESKKGKKYKVISRKM